MYWFLDTSLVWFASLLCPFLVYIDERQRQYVITWIIVAIRAYPTDVLPIGVTLDKQRYLRLLGLVWTHPRKLAVCFMLPSRDATVSHPALFLVDNDAAILEGKDLISLHLHFLTRCAWYHLDIYRLPHAILIPTCVDLGVLTWFILGCLVGSDLGEKRQLELLIRVLIITHPLLLEVLIEVVWIRFDWLEMASWLLVWIFGPDHFTSQLCDTRVLLAYSGLVRPIGTWHD